MAKASSDPREACLAELRHIEEDAVYSAKGQFQAASDWRSRHYWLGLPAAIIAGIAGVSALSTFDHHNIVAGILALLGASLGSANAFLNPAEHASSHHNFGNDYTALRNEARIVGTIEAFQLSDDNLAARVATLSRRRDQLNKKAPPIPRRAFERARKGIEEGEATYADAEPEA